ncbi:hypothetical protein MYA_2494 [Burkholderia sp. KJ006]|nr:hypothetical protein MYA_2494 [Burkholderia sp. KJ006]
MIAPRVRLHASDVPAAGSPRGAHDVRRTPARSRSRPAMPCSPGPLRGSTAV